MFGYTGDHHVSASAWGWVIGTLVIGALGLGALRGLTMRVWSSNGWVLRQGTALTMGLWLVSLLVHFAGDDGGDHAGAAGLVGASFLLYLGITLACSTTSSTAARCRCGRSSDPTRGGRCSCNSRQGPGRLLRDLPQGGAGGPGPGWPGGSGGSAGRGPTAPTTERH